LGWCFSFALCCGSAKFEAPDTPSATAAERERLSLEATGIPKINKRPATFGDSPDATICWEVPFNDASFQRVTLPHTNIELPWHSFDDKAYEFVSVYRRHFRPPHPGTASACSWISAAS
jgi:hypothetical protein